jgi:hypothetical protein
MLEPNFSNFKTYDIVLAHIFKFKPVSKIVSGSRYTLHIPQACRLYKTKVLGQKYNSGLYSTKFYK